MAGDNPHREQGDLFSWAPSGCRLIPFPLSKRIAKIRRTAECYLRRKSDADRAFYWNSQIMAPLRGHLEIFGLPERKIEAELIRFRNAVEAEIDRLHAARARRPDHGPGAA